MSTADDTTWADATTDPFAEPARRSSPLWRWLPLILGVIVFEMTTDPMIAVAVACLKFGWDDVLTALWLVRTDPQPARGRSCALFHAAYGFGKMSLGGLAVGAAGVVCVVQIAALGFVGRVPLNTLFRQSLGGWLVLLVASFMFLILSYAAIVRAVIGGVRVWLGREANRARKNGAWPPVVAPGKVYHASLNRLRVVLMLVAILTANLIFALASLADLWPKGAGPGWVGVGFVLGFWVVLFGVARLAFLVGRAIVADSPTSCWPEVEPLMRDEL